MDFCAVILAAGEGKRMNSTLPKVLHKCNGKELVLHITEALENVGINDICVIVGHDETEQACKKYALRRQYEKLGTGHAAAQGIDYFKNYKNVMVLCGDTPLLTPQLLAELKKSHLESGSKATLISVVLDNAYGYGRIIRNKSGQVVKITEQKDADEEQQKINEINASVYCFDSEFLTNSLSKIKPNNKQGEYYLTDVIGIACAQGEKINSVIAKDHNEVLGINTLEQLAEAELIMKVRKN